MKLYAILCALFPLVAGITAQPVSAAEVHQEWVRETGGAQDDGLGSIVVRTDTSDNAYLGTTGSGAYRTVKYDRDGNELWSKMFGGTAQQYCYAEALSVDGSGNAYVTGECRDEAYNFDMVTVKYDASGTLLWTARYDNTQGGRDFALGLAVDSQGNVYVTGSSFRKESGSDFTTVKYTAAGVQLWVASYDAGAFTDPATGRSRPSDDQAHAIALDVSSNVYVSGAARLLAANYTTTEFATIKYDPAGTQLWVRSRSAGGNGPRASRLAVDRDGNVYVAGSRRPGSDCLGHLNPSTPSLVKYNSDGALQWEAQYPLTEPFVIATMAIGPSGNVSITGTMTSDGCANSVTGDYTRTMQFSPAGAIRWYVSRYTYPTANWAGALAVDLQDNVYVTGFQYAYGSPTYLSNWNTFTEKYDTAGSSLWLMKYAGPVVSHYSGNYGNAIAVDDQGDVFVAGKSWKNNSWPAIVTIRYSQPLPNQPPVSAPGPDQTVECSGSHGSVVTLDGSGSSDPDGDTLTYRWTWSGGSATGAKPVISLPLGATIVTLTVDDGKGGVASAQVKITVRDTTPPVTSIEVLGTSGNNGWYTSDVMIKLFATDSCSGVKEIYYAIDGAETVIAGNAATVTMSAEEKHIFGFFSIDHAGNPEVARSIPIDIDKTPPSITATATPTPNANGWHNRDVTVTFACSDALSGIASCPDPITVLTEGAGQVISGTAVDKAGNAATASVTLNIDKTAPALNISVTPNMLWPPNHKMVTVTPSITASDANPGTTVTLVSVTSSEPDNGLGDGDTANDIMVNSDGTISLRAERSGTGSGRVYTITYQAVDIAGNATIASAMATVPHDMR